MLFAGKLCIIELNNDVEAKALIDPNVDEIHLDFEIGNARVVVTMSGGFFDLGGATTGKAYVHSHNNYEFHLIIDGVGRIESETGTVELLSQQAAIIPSGVVHKGISMDAGNSIKTNFTFTIERIDRKGKEDYYTTLVDAFNSYNCVYKIPHAGKYSEYLEKVFTEIYSTGTFVEQRLRCIFLLFITDLVNDIKPNGLLQSDEDASRQITKDSYKLTRALMEEYVTRYFHKQITLGDLAAVVHLSLKQTERVFVKNFGISFKQYIKKLRIGSAKYMLAETDMPLDEIASRSGYVSYNGFYKLFKTEMKISPQEYRNQKQRSKINENG